MSIYLSDPFYFSRIISTLVILSQILGIATALILLFFRGRLQPVLQFLSRHAVGLAFTVMLVATLSSLTYSEHFGYTPCKLCWFQRIFIFPQVALLGWALLRKHQKEIIEYSLLIALIAAPISLYHYGLQMLDPPDYLNIGPCDPTGEVSCSAFYVRIYDYITIPLMAFTASSLVVILMMTRKMMDKRQ